MSGAGKNETIEILMLTNIQFVSTLCDITPIILKEKPFCMEESSKSTTLIHTTQTRVPQ